jgi:elongation factor Ts
VGCETDPVSKNDEFQAFAERVLRAVHADGPAAVEGFEQERLELSARLGENIVVVDPTRLEGGTLAQYVHPPANKLGVLVQLDGGTPELARQLAMHISFGRPEWIAREHVPPDLVEAERQIYLNSDEVLSKPESAREKIVDGMLGKRFFAATPGGVLVDQAWIHDASQTVGRVLEDAGASVRAYALVSVAGS